MTDLAALTAQARLGDVAIGFFGAIDARDFDGAAGYVSGEATVTGDSALFGAGTWGREALVARLADGFGPLATYHQLANPVFAGPGEGTWMLAARHRRPTFRGGDALTVFGLVTVGLDAGRIARLDFQTRWLEGNPSILTATGEALQPPAAEPFPPPDPLPEGAARLGWLTDRAEIEALMMRFGRALDAKDWPLYRSCLADRLVLDFSQTTGAPEREVNANIFTEFAAARQRKHAAFHQYSNFQVRIDGDAARLRLYMLARHRAPEAEGDALNVFAGWYDNATVRTPYGWKLSRLGHPLRWVEGNAAIKDAPDPEAEAISARLFAG